MKNYELTKRLTSLGITRQGILSLISPQDSAEVIIYATCMENLGTSGSDFDIYIIADEIIDVEDMRDAGNHKIKMFDLDPQYYKLKNVPYFCLDVEYWSKKKIEEIVNDISQKKYVDADELKMIHRLFVGEQLRYVNFRIEDILQKNEFEHYTKEWYALISDGLLHDAVTQFNGNEFFGAISCCRKSLEYAIAGYNAINGNANFNLEKWNSKIFLRSYADNNMKTQYLELMFGNAMHSEQYYIRKCILFIQDILNKELGYLGKKHWIEKERYFMLDETQDVLHII